jgi:hypothetical protein
VAGAEVVPATSGEVVAGADVAPVTSGEVAAGEHAAASNAGMIAENAAITLDPGDFIAWNFISATFHARRRIVKRERRRAACSVAHQDGCPGWTGPMRYGRIISLSSCSRMWQCHTNWPGVSNRDRTRVTSPG